MKKLTIILNDALNSALEDEAASSNRSVEEVAIEAIDLWKTDSELDAEEHLEVEAAIKDWKTKRWYGGRSILRHSAE